MLLLLARDNLPNALVNYDIPSFHFCVYSTDMFLDKRTHYKWQTDQRTKPFQFHLFSNIATSY